MQTKNIITVGALLLGIFLLAVLPHNLLRGTVDIGWTNLKNAEETVSAPKKPAGIYSIIYNRYNVCLEITDSNVVDAYCCNF